MKISSRVALSVLALLPIIAEAGVTDLNQIYNQALGSDPTFAKAHADWMSAKENLPLAMTGNGIPGSGLFPNIDFTGGINEDFTGTGNSPMQSYNSNSYKVTLTQPIFNAQTWVSISAASYGVKAATAKYFSSEQDLMTNVVNKYFEALRANAVLQSTLSEKKSVLQELKQAEAKNKVGVSAVTDVYDAKAQYDQTVAKEISEKNDLQDKLYDLSAITGAKYSKLANLKKTIPYTIVNPKNMQGWVDTALKQNNLIKAQEYQVLASNKDVTAAELAKLPTLDFVGTYGTVTNPMGPPAPGTGTSRQTGATAGLNLNLPIFRGGYDFVNVKQKRYENLSEVSQLHVVQTSIANKTRQTLLTVDSAENQIKADKQALIAAQQRLQSTRYGYIMGVQPMTNVLKAVSNVADTKLSYSNDRYNYVESIVSLKQLTGTLSPQDIETVNKLLTTSNPA